jgi:GTPase-activating protein SST2
MAMRNWDDDFDSGDFQTQSPAAPPGLSDEVGGAYVTVSQQAAEREHRQGAAGAHPMPHFGPAPSSP